MVLPPVVAPLAWFAAQSSPLVPELPSLTAGPTRTRTIAPCRRTIVLLVRPQQKMRDSFSSSRAHSRSHRIFRGPFCPSNAHTALAYRHLTVWYTKPAFQILARSRPDLSGRSRSLHHRVLDNCSRPVSGHFARADNSPQQPRSPRMQSARRQSRGAVQSMQLRTILNSQSLTLN